MTRKEFIEYVERGTGLLFAHAGHAGFVFYDDTYKNAEGKRYRRIKFDVRAEPYVKRLEKFLLGKVIEGRTGNFKIDRVYGSKKYPYGYYSREGSLCVHMVEI